MMNFVDPSMALLAACGGDTIKLFDVSVDPDRDPCTLSYSPSPGSQVNSVKWNHTNLVVASAGDDKKISLWQKNGQSLGTIPPSGVDSGDNIDESISTISFSNKSSRYICSGGSGQVVRIWDLQRKRCIKWLRGHTDTITGALYNCKDEHLASISLKGDLILHNLASGARAAELKDPNGQVVLRVLDYSRISRHLLVTAGDDGSVHLWDTTGRGPKASWLKQHSAPTTGISFSPSNDKIIASVGLDKKLYTYDSGTKRPPICMSYEAPFTSLAFRDDGWILAAGTNNGQVVFYDVRGKRQPITALRAYSNSEAVTSLCWQRLKPIIVNESNCTAETALLGGAGEDSVLMPDPLPSVTSSTISLVTAVPGARNPGRLGLSVDASSLTAINGGSISNNLYISTAEETPHRNHLWTGGALSRLKPPHTTYNNFKDDMEVFSPLVDVQPITPSLDKLWDGHDEARKDHLSIDKKPTNLLFPSSIRRFPFAEDVGSSPHPIFDWKSSSTSRQDDTRSSLSQLGATPPASSKSEESFSATPPEAWGGESLSDKFDNLRQPVTLNVGPSYTNLRSNNISSNQETSSLGFTEHARFSSIPTPLGTKISTPQNVESPRSASLTLPRRFSTYAERLSTTSSFSDGTALASGSPKAKKTGTEPREELLYGTTSQPQRDTLQPDLQQVTSPFAVQLVQRILEEKLSSVQKSIHEDMRNLHIELLRQFHMQEIETSSLMNSLLENQAELMKEVQSLRKEMQQLRQSL
ncbi:WD40 repeat [Macleaya cordata]|uniref:WD40 repeat n=1 Tax=Macleaya cordata TaxID=56857 RepID=A0A200R4W9_MACCD|nr:WD40 repeat [Macleaya cordata]